ncbi:MAG: chemotaxis protein CheA [Oligoflexales bacterium]
MSQENELLDVFREEAEDLLARWESILLEHQNSKDSNLFSELFRVAHTLKGSSKAVGLNDYGTFVHHVEDLVKACQTETFQKVDEAVQCLLEAQVALSEWIENGEPNDENNEKVLIRTKDILGEDHISEAASPAAGSPAQIVKKDAKKPEKRREVLRIPKDRIDQIVQLIGELSAQMSVVDEFQKKTLSFGPDKTAMQHALKYLKSLEEISLSLSMQPVDALFQRLERACRDVAKISGKSIQIEKIGADTEVDKIVLERMTDPLIHLVRNGVDHGVEEPHVRKSLGKPETGAIVFQAELEAGYVVLNIKDDGHGIDVDRVLAKGVEKGIVKDPSKMDKESILKLIFEPNFSTKEQVSEVSGRGVGMDVVNTTLQELGGHVVVQSEKGKGTSFKIFLPTQIALVESLVVSFSTEQFGIPLREFSEIISLDDVKIDTSPSGYECFLWKDEVISLRDLGDFFKVPSLKNTKKNEDQEGADIAVVCRYDGKSLAFRFNKIHGRCSLFVKPLKGRFNEMFGVSGSAILPDGHASLILSLVEATKNYHTNKKEGGYGW